MEFVLERDVERLVDDTGKVKQGLDLLEKDHAAWIRWKSTGQDSERPLRRSGKTWRKKVNNLCRESPV